MAAAENHIELNLVGMVRLLRADGTEVTPRGARARALLAILALSRDMVRGRRWLEGRLWSTRDPKQAGASLRQTLSEVRRALGDADDILIADRAGVGLVPDRVRVDILHDPDSANAAITDGAELMDGLEVPDAAFRAWRDEQRTRLRKDARPPTSAEPAHTAAAAATAAAPVAFDGPPRLLVAADHSGKRVEDAIADALGRQIARSAAESIRLEVSVPGPQTQVHPKNMLKISPMVVDEGGQSMVSMELARPSDGALLWSDAINLAKGGAQLLTEADLIAAANKAAEEIARHANELGANGMDSAAMRSSAMLQTGISEMFTMDGARMQLAEHVFREIEDERDTAVAAAWRSMLALILYTERIATDAQDAREQVLHHLARALEANTRHPTILGLASQVVAFLNLPGHNAMELAKEALRINPWNPMAKLAEGIAYMRKGDVKRGYQTTAKARAFASRLEHRHWWDMSFCLAALAAGKLDEAIEAAEASLTFHPTFRPPMRHLYVLYLHKGRIADAEEMLRRMRQLEPEFSLRQMREDPTYPVITIRRTPLILLPDMMS